MKKVLSLVLAILLLVCFMVSALAESSYGIIHGGSLRMRESATTDGHVIKSYPSGTWVEILDDMAGPFYHVIAEDGQKGYMVSNYITVESLDAGSWATIENGSRYVNLRSGPSTSHKIIGRYTSGTRLEVLSYGDIFSKVRINGSEVGYMSSGLIRLDGETVWEEAYVESQNGGSVHLRKGPSANADIIASYQVGTKTIILAQGRNWHKVFINGQFGYMMANFLQTDAQGNVATGDGTSASGPAIGDGAKPASTSNNGGGIGTGVHFNEEFAGEFEPDDVYYDGIGESVDATEVDG